MRGIRSQTVGREVIAQRFSAPELAMRDPFCPTAAFRGECGGWDSRAENRISPRAEIIGVYHVRRRV